MAKRGCGKSKGTAKRPSAGKRGPPKKPAAILKQRGTFRADRHSDDLDLVTPSALPSPPKHLSEAERAKWCDVGAKLATLGLCSELDAIALEVLVRSYCGMNNAAHQLAKSDLVIAVGEAGALQANPLVGVIAKQLATLKWCLTQFGMTPSARTSIRLPEPKQVDPMAALLGRR